MSSPAFETFLARLYTDAQLRIRFLASPAAVAQEFPLSSDERRAIEAIDRDGLILAAESYANKRRRWSQHSRRRAESRSSGTERTSGLFRLLVRNFNRVCDRVMARGGKNDSE